MPRLGGTWMPTAGRWTYIITHSPPSSIVESLDRLRDALTDFLEEIRGRPDIASGCSVTVMGTGQLMKGICSCGRRSCG